MSQPRLLGGRYELDGTVGRGGMAEVHRARDLRLDRMVAIKTLRSDLAQDETFQARFRREAQSAASLNHPSIIAVYDTGEDEIDGANIPYIVMEYVDGRTLQELLNDGRRLLPERTAEIAEGVLRALDYSHRHSIVHRDIKPANVMLTRQAEVKVMDFGIARSTDDSQATMTQTSQVIGTAQYLSPEQARGERVDARSDLYATGCVLYELLTGRPPFTGDTPVSIAYQHVREDPVPPRQLDPEVPQWLEEITLRAMAKDPEDRYQSAEQMRADIQRGMSGMQTEASTAVMAAAGGTTALPPVQDDDGDFDERDERRGGGAGKALLWVLLALSVIGALVFLGWLLTRDGVEEIDVPDVSGMPVAEAEAELEDVGFTNVADEPQEQPSAEVAEGNVIETDPAAGTAQTAETEILLVVSTGEEEDDQVDVPDVSGQDQDSAMQTLQDAGLQIGSTSTEETEDQDPNTVLRTSPAAGSTVQEGTAVNLVLATEPEAEEVEVPDLIGLEQGEAEQELSELELEAQAQPQPDPDAEPGTVINQNPGAGSTVEEGTTVQIVVADDPGNNGDGNGNGNGNGNNGNNGNGNNGNGENGDDGEGEHEDAWLGDDDWFEEWARNG
ncbi:Stk1 family PASTA domain-containing Ser/Thr kinase [Lipingzhangella sp. LS1_29]|uniref:non-specific serine/threonine protein kinase n=1 Tax=Lipingzhangella rawalii TaxID=2055835 RepID=A0ABU2H9G2_9ACTN|nr:Stk1 family PASTA domain-containing Ser/Thr kinase [Lipingzhangella rawalii]MDS1271652.1 Stk1 family PASTA domain-containing Ser/Thr kinase [Lipingzhangella rawalii]